MTMNTEKLLKLIEIVDKSIKFENLHRLVDGDLSDLGDAIIEGKKVILKSSGEQSSLFTLNRSDYIVEQPRITVGSVSFPKPITEAPMVGDKYWKVDICSESIVEKYTWRGDYYDFLPLVRGLLHLDEKSAREHAEILIKISKGKF